MVSNNDRQRRIERLLDQIQRSMFTLKMRSIPGPISPELFETVVIERVAIEEQLMIAQATIEVLSNQVQKNEIVLKNFTPEDLDKLRAIIATRLACEDRERRANEV